MKTSNILITVLSCVVSLSVVACGSKEGEVRDGVMYVTRALQEADGNPLSRATYENIIGRGGTALDYIKYVTPKDHPVLQNLEYDQPTRPWTVVVRPGAQPGEYSVAGYGASLKQPLIVESVTISLPSE